MDPPHGFKLNSLGIDKKRFGKIYTFVDFGNVNYWYEYDERDANDKKLPPGNKLVIHISELAKFLKTFSEHTRFYFGLDPKNKKSLKIITLARNNFEKTITKPIQRIKHYLDEKELAITTRSVNQDLQGSYIYIPKCNFDTEISIDAVRLLNSYDTFCLLSSDADFAALLEYLRRRNKKILLFSSGYVSHWLKDKADLNVNSQNIKGLVTFVKRKSRL